MVNLQSCLSDEVWFKPNGTNFISHYGRIYAPFSPWLPSLPSLVSLNPGGKLSWRLSLHFSNLWCQSEHWGRIDFHHITWCSCWILHKATVNRQAKSIGNGSLALHRYKVYRCIWHPNQSNLKRKIPLCQAIIDWIINDWWRGKEFNSGADNSWSWCKALRN